MNSKQTNQYSLFMKEFLDLPKMFLFIKNVERGEMFRLLPYIVKEYDKDWSSTLDHNTYMDTRRFVSLLKVYHVKHNIPKIDKYERKRKFFVQMFSGLTNRANGITERVETTVNKVDDLVNKMHEVIDSSQRDIQAIFSNLNTFTSLFLPSDNKWTDIIAYMIKFAAFGYLLSQDCNQSFSNIMALLTLILPTGVGNSILSCLSRAIQGIRDKFVKPDVMVTQGNEVDGTIVAFFKVTVQLMQTMFTSVPMETFKNMHVSVTKLKMISDYLRSSTTIFDYIMKLFQKCMEIVGEKLLKYYGKLPKFLQEESLNSLVDRYVDIKEKQLDIKAKNNSFFAKIVVDLYNDALKAQAKIVKTNKKADFGQSKLLGYITIMIKNLEPVILKIPDHIKGTKNARRTKPFWVYIFGEPRIGKTSMYQPYVVNAVAHCCKLIDKYRDYSEYTYFRNCGDEYWEKYCGQPVLWYNDLFQVFTNEQKVNIGIEELTNVVDDNLYPLNMAFEEKHNVYFDSQLVISNAQKDITGQTFISNKCLSEGTHINSRRNLVIRLRVDSRYKINGGLNYVEMDRAKKAGVPYIGDLFPKDMYLVDFMDVNNGMLLKTVTFEESIRVIVNTFKAYKAHQDKFKENLFKHFEEMWQDEEEEDVLPVPAPRMQAQGNESILQNSGSEQWQDAMYQASVHEFRCDQCEEIYRNSTMLNEDERNEIRTILLLQCPHQEQKVVSRWRDFGDMVKVNIKALWKTITEFVKQNKIYMLIAGVVAMLPVVYTVISGYYSNRFMANSAECTIKKSKIQVERMVAQEYGQQNKDVEAKLMRNICTLGLRRKDTNYNITLGSSLGVGGDIFMLPRHFYERFVQFDKLYDDDNLYMELGFASTQVYSFPFSNVKLLDVNYEHLVDVAFIQVPKLCCLSKLDRFFVTTKDEPVLFNSYLFGRRIGSSSMHNVQTANMKMVSREYYQNEWEIPELGKCLPMKKIIIPEGFEFRANGVVVGDCGMVLMNVDDKMNARKIMGLHVAGTANGALGLAATVYQEDVQKAFELAGNFVAMENFDLEPTETSVSILKDGLSDIFHVIGATKKVDGKKVKLSIPMRTKIQRSAFFDLCETDLGPHTMMPARLRPFKEGDVVISPLLKNIAKMRKTTIIPDDKITANIVDHMATSILQWNSDYVTEPRVLTDFEAVNGVGNLNKLDLTTSAGFPYQLNSPSGGKRDWFSVENNTFIMLPPLQQRVTERLELAKQGLIKETYFVDTLKDETRPIEKVLSGKTRVFQVGPMCLSILMRKYFGSFIMHCQTTFINGEMGIGINPNSYDWTLLIRRLLRVSNQFINGDYSDYDASVSQVIMSNLVEVINRFYRQDYDSEDNVVRRVLFATFLNSIHIVEDVVFQRLQGNMSGIALTTIVNCLYNMYLIRYAYMMLVDYDLCRYNDLISSTFYGDDNLIAVHPSISEKLNMLTYCNLMKSLLITYTTPDKSDMNVSLYGVDQISYLKRKFVKIGNIFYAQLSKDVINEIPRWSESDPYNMLDQLNRFNCVLYESVNYGLSEYKWYYNLFVMYCLYAKIQGLEIDGTQLLTYPYILRSMFPQFFSSDLTKALDQAHSVLKESGSLEAVNFGSPDSTNSSNLNQYLTTSNDLQIQSNETRCTRATVQVSRQLVAQENNYEEFRDLMDNIEFSINFKDEFKMFAMANQNIVLDSDSKNVRSATVLMVEDENAGETVTRQQITTSFDDTIPHKAISCEWDPPISVNPFVDVDLPSFINREWYVGEIPWGSDYNRNDLTALGTYPYGALTYILGKVKNIAYWAPDIKLVFKVNGTPMHYGRFMIGAIPAADTMHSTYLKPQNLSQTRFVQVSPTGNQTVILSLPWINMYDRLPVQSNAGSNVPVWPWHLYGWPAVPLGSASDPTPAPITISIYSIITNPRFSGYTHYTEPGFIAQSNEQATLSDKENVTGKVTQYGIINYANTVAKDVESLVGDMSQLATDVGFSNAPSLIATKPVIMRNTYIGRSEDLPATVMLGPSQNQGLAVSSRLANSHLNSMLIGRFAGRMSLIETIRITSSTAVSTVLFNFPLNPTAMFYADYGLKDVANTFYPHPAHYVARLFRVWRGSFKFHFSFVSSAFHSMRVRFSYSPQVTPGTAMPMPNASTSAYNINEVWDINNQTDYSVRIPFHYISEYAQMTETVGRIYLNALTKLSSILDTPEPIYLQVWAGMDDDFQVAYPYIPTVGTALSQGIFMSNPDVGTWHTLLEKAGGDELDIDESSTRTTGPTNFDHVTFVAQSNERSILTSGNPMLNYRTQQFPSMSSEGLEGLVYHTIGGVETKHKTYRVCTSYEIASIKELLNMLCPIERTIVHAENDPVTVPTIQHIGRHLAPYGWVNRGANDDVWYSFLFQFMAVFRYARGSVRFAAQSEKGTSAVGVMDKMDTSLDGEFWKQAIYDPFFDDVNLSLLTRSAHNFANISEQPADVTIPYFSTTKNQITLFGPPVALPKFSSPCSTASILVRVPVPANTTKGATIDRVVWFVSGGDDFQLGYQLPIPRCRYGPPT